MCWKGYSLYSCSAEFRLFWVQSKLSESDASAAHATSISSGGGGGGGQQEKQQGTRRFLPLPAYRCTPGGLEVAARQAVRWVPHAAPMRPPAVLFLAQRCPAGCFHPGMLCS